MEGATLLRVLVLCLLGVTKCLSLEIVRLSIPKFVQNGSEESVLLDCEYTYSMREVKKLVVKWFHDDNPNPVYQWIPELDSKQHSEKFRVNEDYEVPSGNEYTRSRALNIQRPTTELSGRYSCQVQSLEGSDSAEDTMIVYSHPSSVNLNYTIDDGTVRVTCEVEGVYPLPEISLFQIEPGEIEHTPIDDVKLEFEHEDGAYEVELYSDIPEDELESEGLRFFGCTVTLNGTEYEKEVKVPYFPDPVAEKQEGEDTDDDDDDDAASTRSSSLVLLFSLLPLLFLLT